MTMVVHHFENRLALNSNHPNEQLHEFQIVHALITQCRKQSSCEDSDSNCNGYETPPLEERVKSNGGSRGEKTSFVKTIRLALAQATNPCAKQNVTHPVSIASTVKNIISQFSRQTCHASICLSSPSREAISRPNNTSPSELPKKTTSSTSEDKPTLPTQAQSNAQPSTSVEPTIERTEIKSAAVVRQNVTNPIATKPKTRSVRSRNATRLMRHESAPITSLDQMKAQGDRTVSVRRSKSDAVCYAKTKHSRRKIESNVQTKVLHFENCCKAFTCIECHKRSLEEGLASATRPHCSKNTSRADTIRPKPETYMGALSYHKPSIISQNATTAAATASDILDGPAIELPLHDTLDETTAKVMLTPGKSRAVICPGGTYFPSNEETHEFDTSNQQSELMSCDESENGPDGLSNAGVIQRSLIKRRRSISESDPECIEQENSDLLKSTGSSNDCENCGAILNVGKANTKLRGLDDDYFITENVREIDCNLYTRLCSENEDDVLPELSHSLTNSNEADLNLVFSEDSSDSMDSSSSSSGEFCISPRQDYLVCRTNGAPSPLRRNPSKKYKKMRRKLKKLFSRSKPDMQPEIVLTQSEKEQEFLASLRIPTPSFMLKESSSFDARRKQLAMHFDNKQDWMKRLPDHVLAQIFSYLDTRSLAMLKCVCKDFNFLIDACDIRGTDSLWVKDKRYLEDPCRYCRKKFTPGDVSMCRYHAKYYHCDLPYGRSYWMCCFEIEKNAPGCKTGIHDNHWS